MSELNPQEMTTSEIRARLREIKTTSKEATQTRRSLSKSKKLFIIKVAEQVAKTDKARADKILESFGLPPLRSRKDWRSQKKTEK